MFKRRIVSDNAVMNSEPAPAIDPVHARLIQARAKVMDRDIHLGEMLCRFTFAEGSKVVPLAVDHRQIFYNPAYVAEASIEELMVALKEVARRALGDD